MVRMYIIYLKNAKGYLAMIQKKEKKIPVGNRCRILEVRFYSIHTHDVGVHLLYASSRNSIGGRLGGGGVEEGGGGLEISP